MVDINCDKSKKGQKSIPLWFTTVLTKQFQTILITIRQIPTIHMRFSNPWRVQHRLIVIKLMIIAIKNTPQI